MSTPRQPSAFGPVLITGAGVRLGRTLAIEAARQGFDVAIHVHTAQAEGQALAQELQTMGRAAVCLEADLMDPEATQSLIRRASAAFDGRALTALINNAALFLPDTQDPDGARHDQINFQAPRLLIQALAQQLPPSTEGSVVNILDGTPAAPTFQAYQASKDALRAETPLLARSYAPALRVNAIEPGPTLRGVRQSAEHFDSLVAATLLKRPTAPFDVARATLFLLTCPALTGVLLPVNNGFHLTARR